MCASVARDVHQSVVAAGPDHARLDGRFGARENGAVILDARVVLGDRSAGRPHLRLVVAREVGTDDRPALTAVGGLEQVLRSGVHGVRIVRGEEDREVPLEGPRIDVADFTRAVIQPNKQAAVRATVDHVGVRRIGDDVAALAARGGLPVAKADARSARAAQDTHRGVVLLRTEDVVREGGVNGETVELRGRLIVE